MAQNNSKAAIIRRSHTITEVAKMKKLIGLIIVSLFLVGCTMKPITVDFKKLSRPDKPNWYLMCPKDFCNTKPDLVSPCFEANEGKLKAAWERVIAKEPRISKISETKEVTQYIQRSLVFRFPDYLSVQFIALNSDQSTLALLSFSKYGHSDFGVNKDRVDRLVKNIKGLLPVCRG